MKKQIFIRILFIAMMFSSIEAHAYFLMTFKTQTIDYNLPTRLLTAGRGEKLGTQFQEVATAKALKYRELNANEQIVLISSNEPDIDNARILRNFGFVIHKETSRTFDGEKFLEEAIKFKKILSLDIFGHSSAQYGLYFDSRRHRLERDSSGIAKLKGNFLKDAYAILHGCNTGFNLAPTLSALWGIPVAGSMTSTNFQKMHSDGNFYLTEKGFYPNEDWAEVNDKSYESEVKCSSGACLRLKPDNSRYIGFWGEYAGGGLPFYKFFCIKNSPQDCMRIMAKSMFSSLGEERVDSNSSIEEYQRAVVDFLCPISIKKDLRSECEKNLANALVTGIETYNPFAHTQLECDFKGCKAKISCKEIIFTNIIKPGSCELENTFNGKSSTIVREYKAYLEGFKSLKN